MELSETIKDMIINGKTVKEMCDETGLKKDKIYRTINKNGWKGLLKPKQAEALMMLSNGELVSDVIEKTGISRRTAFNIIKSSKIKYTGKLKTIKKGSWPDKIFKELDNIAFSFKSRYSDLNIDIDDIKDEIIEQITIIDSHKSIKVKEHYFKKVIHLRLKNFAKKIIFEEKTFKSLNTYEEVPVKFNLDYAIDEIYT